MREFWPLRLTSAEPAALDAFELEYHGIVARIDQLKVDVKTLCSAHLLLALPPSLDGLNTYISAQFRDELPSVSTIFELVRDEVSRAQPAAGAGRNAHGLAAQAPPPRPPFPPFPPNQAPPAPCRHCQGPHWNRLCPRNSQRKAAAAAAAAVAITAPALPAAALAHSEFSTAAFSTAAGAEGWVAAAALAGPPFPLDAAILESGATHHMSGRREIFSELRNIPAEEVGGISGKSCATGVGTICVLLTDGRRVRLEDALYVPGMAATLVSSARLFTTQGYTSVFGQTGSILDRNHRLVASASRHANGLYKLEGRIVVCTRPPALALVAARALPLTTWHRRFAHLHPLAIRNLARSGAVTGLELSPAAVKECSDLVCNACLSGKAVRSPFSGPVSRSGVRLGRVFSDLLTLSTPSLSGCRYAIVWVDDHTRMLWTRPLAAKSDAFRATQEWIAWAEKASGCPLKALHTDNGGEYTSHQFRDYHAGRGIEHECTTPYSPQQNGVAERVNRTLVEAVLSMLADSGLPPELWAEALNAFTDVKNLAPHAALGSGVTPRSLWDGKPASVSHLRAFGCRAWATRPADAYPARRKLEPKGEPLIFVGYEPGRKAYHLYSPSTHKITISRDVAFVEHEFPATAKAALPLPTTREALFVDLPAAPPPPSRPRAPPSFAAPSPGVLATPSPLPRDVQDYQPPPSPSPVPAQDAPESPDPIDLLMGPFAAGIAAFTAAVASTLPDGFASFQLPSQDPANWKQALTDRDRVSWEVAAAEEFRSLVEDYGVFEPVAAGSLPGGAKLLGGRFVFRRKRDKQGQVGPPRCAGLLPAPRRGLQRDLRSCGQVRLHPHDRGPRCSPPADPRPGRR